VGPAAVLRRRKKRKILLRELLLLEPLPVSLLKSSLVGLATKPEKQK
jgi:hypothetical protein